MKKGVFSKLFMGVCICLICCGFVMGCGKDEEGVGGVQEGMTQEVMTREVMNVSGNSVYMSDYYLYLMQYFYNYNITPLQLTEESIDAIMEAATNDLKAEMVRKSLVEEAGLEANDAQLEMIETMVTAYRGTFTDELLNDYGIDETAVRNMIARQLDTYLITEKAAGELQAEFMGRYEEQYAEYQFRHMYYVLFPNVQVDFDENGELILDETGNPIPLTEEEMEEQRVLAEEFRERAVEGAASGDTSASMELLAVEYGIGAFSGEQYYVNGLYDEELSRMVESLSGGEISEVTMTDAGYMIVRMDNSNDSEYKEQMIAQLAAQATEECKDIMVQSWVAASDIQDIQPDQELLNAIDVMALCEEMIACGIWYDPNNLYGQ